MRFLADMGISQTTVKWLKTEGHDAIHLRDERLQILEDSLIVIKARSEERIILTFDLDFAALMAVSNENFPSIVILRLKNQKYSNQSRKLNLF